MRAGVFLLQCMVVANALHAYKPRGEKCVYPVTEQAETDGLDMPVEPAEEILTQAMPATYQPTEAERNWHRASGHTPIAIR